MACFSRWTIFTTLLFKQYLLRLVYVYFSFCIFIFSLSIYLLNTLKTSYSILVIVEYVS